MSAITQTSWHAEGLRWIGSLFLSAADRLERLARDNAPLEPAPDYRPPDDFVSDVRHRIQNRYY